MVSRLAERHGIRVALQARRRTAAPPPRADPRDLITEQPPESRRPPPARNGRRGPAGRCAAGGTARAPRAARPTPGLRGARAVAVVHRHGAVGARARGGAAARAAGTGGLRAGRPRRGRSRPRPADPTRRSTPPRRGTGRPEDAASPGRRRSRPPPSRGSATSAPKWSTTPSGLPFRVAAGEPRRRARCGRRTARPRTGGARGPQAAPPRRSERIMGSYQRGTRQVQPGRGPSGTRRADVPSARTASGRRGQISDAEDRFDSDLGWLLDDLVARVPQHAEHAVVLSARRPADGVVGRADPGRRASTSPPSPPASRASPRARADASAAVPSGRPSSRCESAFLFVTAAGEGACLAVLADEDADVGLIAYEMAMLVTRRGPAPHLARARTPPSGRIRRGDRGHGERPLVPERAGATGSTTRPARWSARTR